MDDTQRCNACMCVQDEQNTECTKCGRDDCLMYPFEPLPINESIIDREIKVYKKSLSVIEGLWSKRFFESKVHELNTLKFLARKRHERYMNNIAEGRDV